MVYFRQLSQLAKKSLGSGFPPSINAMGEGGAKGLPQPLHCFQASRTFQLCIRRAGPTSPVPPGMRVLASRTSSMVMHCAGHTATHAPQPTQSAAER